MAILSCQMLFCCPCKYQGMQSINLGVSDKDVLEQYNLVWIITDYDIDVIRLPRFAEEITIETRGLDLQSSILLPPIYYL